MLRTGTAVIIATLFLLAACSDGSDSMGSTNPPDTLPQNLMVYFPPLQAQFPGTDSISVHGRIDPPINELSLEVDAGAGVVLASIAADGTWRADDVALSTGNVVPVSISTIRASSERTTQVVSELWRTTPDAPPFAVAPNFDSDGWFLHFGHGDIRQYDANGNEIQRSGPIAGLTAPGIVNDSETPPPSPIVPGISNVLENWYATDELVALFTPETGGCRVSAIDPIASAARELLLLNWPGRFSLNNCEQASLSVVGDNVVVVDEIDGRLHVINPAGAVVSTSVTGGPLVIHDALAVPQRSDQINFIRFSAVDFSFSERVILINTNDIFNAASINTAESETYEPNGERPLRGTNVGDAMYIWDNGRHLLFDRQTESLQEIQTSGYVATDITDAVTDSTGNLLLLDRRGRLHTVDMQSQLSAPPVDFAPYIQAPIAFSDNRSVANTVFFTMEHAQSTSGVRGGVSRSWENLYALDINTLSAHQVYATSTFRNGLSFNELNFFGISRFPSRVQNEMYSIQYGNPGEIPKRLQVVNHADGQRTLFDLGNSGLSDDDEFVIGVDGEHLVINRAGGVFEYDIATQTLTRSLRFNDALPDYGKLRVAARFPGEDGAIYLTNSPFNRIYRVDFDAGQLVTVSGPQTGAGPGTLFLTNPWLDSWSAEDNAAYFSTPNQPTILRVDLATGERSVVFSAVDSSQYPLPTELKDIHYLPDRNALLASGNDGVYYLDITTGAAAAIPLQVAQ